MYQVSQQVLDRNSAKKSLTVTNSEKHWFDVSYVIRELADSILSSLLRYQMFHKIYRFFESSKILRKRHFYYWFDTFAEKGLVIVFWRRNAHFYLPEKTERLCFDFFHRKSLNKMSAEFLMPSTKNEISEPSLINLSHLNSWSTRNTITKSILVAFLRIEPN